MAAERDRGFGDRRFEANMPNTRPHCKRFAGENMRKQLPPSARRGMSQGSVRSGPLARPRPRQTPAGSRGYLRGTPSY
jgi:hypothetical protein